MSEYKHRHTHTHKHTNLSTVFSVCLVCASSYTPVHFLSAPVSIVYIYCVYLSHFTNVGYLGMISSTSQVKTGLCWVTMTFALQSRN